MFPLKFVLTILALNALALGANAGAGKVFTDCDGCPEMVEVSPGEFQMGSTEGLSNGRPVTRVRIEYPFAVGRFEVTRKQFYTFARETRRQVAGQCWRIVREWLWEEQDGASFEEPGFAQTDDHPAVCVSWNDAAAYAKWLGEKTGRPYRLLTHAEWEYVARGGRGAQKYWWGDAFRPDHANARGMGEGDKWLFTAPVGSFPANPFGVFDVAGNAAEWVQDCAHFNYKDARTDGEAWQGSCIPFGRTKRGGSWGGKPDALQSAANDWSREHIRHSTLGFRIALTLVPRPAPTGE